MFRRLGQSSSPDRPLLQNAVNRWPADLDLPEGFAYVRQTKNGEPRPLHLPPVAVAPVVNRELIEGRTVFRLGKSGYLYKLPDAAETLSR